ncbi:hypothetical protein NS337_00500 [Pseudomonas oryzihabitans]|uniref:DUF1654 domain-containing protein n=1 Tax=Pseudomonas oryzihabitans TaxID=47885 RepID=UPI0007375849|nr:DUF1654 domain-containing protein [Pseudomonas psychrotolerans]KTT57158.1 hypothetical protein NS337_00500 [Pseudomonas psychrotolerans]
MSKPAKQTMSAQERLSIRISNMITSPKAQLERRVRVHQLDTDPDHVWELVLESLAESAELDVTFEDDGDVTIRWEPESREVTDEGEVSVEQINC